MTMLRILQYPDPRLKTKASPVANVHDARIQRIIDDMFETLYNTAHCAGLAATQLDIKNPPRITVIDLSSTKNEPLCLINPHIVERQGIAYEPEGCMSVYPDILKNAVKRAERVTAKALDRAGNPIEIDTGEFLAKCIQHEVDHLNGILYIDHLSPLKRNILDKKVTKLRSNPS